MSFLFFVLLLLHTNHIHAHVDEARSTDVSIVSHDFNVHLGSDASPVEVHADIRIYIAGLPEAGTSREHETNDGIEPLMSGGITPSITASVISMSSQQHTLTESHEAVVSHDRQAHSDALDQTPAYIFPFITPSPATDAGSQTALVSLSSKTASMTKFGNWTFGNWTIGNSSFNANGTGWATGTRFPSAPTATLSNFMNTAPPWTLGVSSLRIFLVMTLPHIVTAYIL